LCSSDLTVSVGVTLGNRAGGFPQATLSVLRLATVLVVSRKPLSQLVLHFATVLVVSRKPLSRCYTWQLCWWFPASHSLGVTLGNCAGGFPQATVSVLHLATVLVVSRKPLSRCYTWQLCWWFPILDYVEAFVIHFIQHLLYNLILLYFILSFVYRLKYWPQQV
jgi:hypothetical protein